MEKLQHMLLLDNDLYLQAVQHHKVDLSALGLEELRYDFASGRNTSGRRQLKAVVPQNNQISFLQKAGVVQQTVATIPEQRPVQHHRIRYRKLRKDAEKEKSSKSAKAKAVNSNDQDPLFVAHPARRTSLGGTPLYRKDVDAHIKFVEREREEALARQKEKERQTKMGTNFDIIGPRGEKLVYDNEGRLVPEHVFEKRREEAEREKKRHSQEKRVPPHSTELIEKTRRFVEDLRKRVELVGVHLTC
jgi:hypothetical protein